MFFQNDTSDEMKIMHYQQQIKIAKILLLVLAVLTVFNYVMVMIGAKAFFLMGASLPVYLLISLKETPFRVFGMILGFLVAASYFLFYFFSRKKPKMLIVPALFFSLDALFEVFLGMMNRIVDFKSFVLHALFIFYFYIGYLSDRKLALFREEEQKKALVTEEDAELSEREEPEDEEEPEEERTEEKDA